MSGPHTAFFYGTLMEPKVFFTVVQGNGNPSQAIKDLYTFTPAILHDYTRHRVQFADYPGMISEAGGSVLGIYATGLTDANILKLDFFEGSEYKKKIVSVELRGENGGGEEKEEKKEAMAYIYMRPEGLERVEWSFEEFRKDKMHVWTRESHVFEGCDDYAEFEKTEQEDAQGHDKKHDMPK
ncbi:AIG2-like family protein [Colletotrichum orchidophilum]|uniref:Putative gamma-glutamylcyclotransferase n=1 Tax=Colletotrichum orchidophilum TaxID=1209926 RepID=A0A1G4B629_9PEZI|nr:AIG2-like family protein [Colletotrichum orchidophilum]OHE96735.1 AIG2-like family protein [Colletotrichum orchidophilum]